MASIAPGIDALKAKQRAFIQKLLESELGITAQEIATLPRCNNNFIHFVTFTSPISSDLAVSNKPGTNAIPHGTTKAVFRIGNPASMFNHAVKVENTVAVMQLVREALADLAIVPHVYSWNKNGGPSDNGWILEQYMDGSNIESEFHHSLSKNSQRIILSQIANILKKLQDFRLPTKAAGFGGLVFDENGYAVSGPFVVEPYTGPYPDMKSFYKDMLRVQLAEADKSRVAKGWRQNGLRERLDTFLENGLESVISKTLTEDVQPNLIIGDVVIANFLIHPTTYQILGFVDYDCSHTGHPLHEFFFSSFSVNYCAVVDDPAINAALFHGFPSPLPPSISPTSPEYDEEETPQWEVMAMFEGELERVKAASPSTVKGAEGITNVYRLMSEVCPFHFLMERWIERQSEEKLQEHVESQWNKIDKGLAKWGF